MVTEAARHTSVYRQGFPTLCLLYAAAAGLTTARLTLEDSTRFTFAGIVSSPGPPVLVMGVCLLWRIAAAVN